jgi:ion channel
MRALWLPYFAVSSNPPLLEVFAVGAAVLVTITLVHGSILGFIVRDYHRGAKRLLQHANHPFWASLQFGRAVLLMLVLHVIDMCIWATMLNRLGLVPDVRNSLYFTANSYTTLGYGSMPLGLGWRELSPMMAISGLFTFAWTTSVMFNVVGYQRQLTERLADEFARKKQLHRDLLAELNALRRHEAEQERLAIAAERRQEARQPFLARCRMRWAERKETYAIRRQAMEQAAKALEKEREARAKIYQPPAQIPPEP